MSIVPYVFVTTGGKDCVMDTYSPTFPVRILQHIESQPPVPVNFVTHAALQTWDGNQELGTRPRLPGPRSLQPQQPRKRCDRRPFTAARMMSSLNMWQNFLFIARCGSMWLSPGLGHASLRLGELLCGLTSWRFFLSCAL
jgi:hypothetical protein